MAFKGKASAYLNEEAENHGIDDSIIMDDSTGAKKSSGSGKGLLKAGALLLLTGAVVVGGYHAKNYIDGKVEDRKMDSFVSYHTVDDLTNIGGNFYTDSAYDKKFCEGYTLYNSLLRNGVKYCELLDEYYTEDGIDIVKATYSVDVQETVEPTIINVDGKKVYSVPSGYVYSNSKGVRKYTVEVVKILPSGMDLENVVIDMGEGVTVLSKELVGAELIKTRPYSDIIDYELVFDVPDQAEVQNDLYPATLKMIKRN